MKSFVKLGDMFLIIQGSIFLRKCKFLRKNIILVCLDSSFEISAILNKGVDNFYAYT